VVGIALNVEQRGTVNKLKKRTPHVVLKITPLPSPPAMPLFLTVKIAEKVVSRPSDLKF
jgi:hypothetical protein